MWAVVFIGGGLSLYVGTHFHTWAVVLVCGWSFLNVGDRLHMWVVVGQQCGCPLLCFSHVVLCCCRCSQFIGCHNLGGWYCSGLLMWHLDPVGAKEVKWGGEASTYCIW